MIPRLKTPLPLIALSVGMLLCLLAMGCSPLSSEAKEIVGQYYNTEISDKQPVMQLFKDGKCVITAIKPGVLTYSVKGTWNVERDSLLLHLDPSTLHADGDESLIGSIPERIGQRIAGQSDVSLQLERDGVVYSYKRN